MESRLEEEKGGGAAAAEEEEQEENDGSAAGSAAAAEEEKGQEEQGGQGGQVKIHALVFQTVRDLNAVCKGKLKGAHFDLDFKGTCLAMKGARE
jgi:hypothetical protein